MAEEGVRDFQLAKRKAVQRLGGGQRAKLPTNTEIQAHLSEYLDLFHGARLPARVQARQALAVQTMTVLDRFSPRLVGRLTEGEATEHSPVELHVFADSAKAIADCLAHRGIPARTAHKRLRFGGERFEQATVYEFRAGDIPVEVVVFPLKGLREAPLSPVDGRPMRRVPLKKIRS